MISEPILDEKVTEYKSKVRYSVNLYKDFIKLYDANSEKNIRTIQIRDISGSALSKITNADTNAYLTVYTYVKSKNNLRKREELILEFNKFNEFERNFQLAQKWDKELKTILKNDADINNIKPFLILVNPKSGAGKAKNIYYERVLTILNEAIVPHKLVFTEYANFAREYVQKLDLSEYRGIVAISGDGLMYEILNGLGDRKDCAEAIKFPISQIPGGSANALACSLCFINKQGFRGSSLEEFAASMTFNLIKARPEPLDIISIQLPDKSIVQSFLSVQWAIIADVDLESEKYRYLGELRFTIGAIKRILDLRIYKGRVSFLPTDDFANYQPKDKTIKLIKNNYETESNTVETSCRPFKYLRPFNEPVPNDWLIMEEDFVLFLLMSLPILTPDFTATNEATTNDGCMHLIFIKSGIPKLEIIRLFTDTASANYLNSPYVEYVKIKAFRLEPLPLKVGDMIAGNMMIDGETIPYGNIQGELMPSLGNVYTFKN